MRTTTGRFSCKKPNPAGKAKGRETWFQIRHCWLGGSFLRAEKFKLQHNAEARAVKLSMEPDRAGIIGYLVVRLPEDMIVFGIETAWFKEKSEVQKLIRQACLETRSARISLMKAGELCLTKNEFALQQAAWRPSIQALEASLRAVEDALSKIQLANLTAKQERQKWKKEIRAPKKGEWFRGVSGKVEKAKVDYGPLQVREIIKDPETP